MKDLKNFKIVDIFEKYLKKETTVGGDVALPDDKAAYDTPVGKKDLKQNKKKKKKKKKLLIDEPAVNAEKKRGGSS